MNLIETLALIAAMAAIAWLPHGEDNPPAVVRTESHRQWVREQCARPDLTDDDRTACKNFWENDK